eukprot:s597_g22.t2
MLHLALTSPLPTFPAMDDGHGSGHGSAPLPRRRSRSEEREESRTENWERTEEFQGANVIHSSYFDRVEDGPNGPKEIKLPNIMEDDANEHPKVRARAGREIFWSSLVESAAAAEVVLNLVLPSLVCSRHAGLWQPPSEWLLILLTLAMNLGGTFLEGFFKATRLLSQTIRWSQKDHLLVFVTAEAFSAGALSVATSFPGVSGSASGLPLGLNSLWFGAIFSLSNMLLGLLFYLWGSRTGRLCFKREWPAILRFAEAWQKFARATVLLAIFLPMLGRPFISLVLRGESLPPLPLDMSEPELRPNLALPKLQYNGWVILECPPFIIGLLCGIVMSVCGAALATFFCGRFESHERPAARLLVNLAASLMAYTARGIDAAVDSAAGQNPLRTSSSDFLRSKFVSSFCGALSAFSGTIGDIADVQFGCATEDSMLDTPEKRSSKAPQLRGLSRIPAIQNFLLHWLLTLLVMWGCARFETWPRVELVEMVTSSSSPSLSLGNPSLVRREKGRSKRDHSSLEPDTEVFNRRTYCRYSQKHARGSESCRSCPEFAACNDLSGASASATPAARGREVPLAATSTMAETAGGEDKEKEELWRASNLFQLIVDFGGRAH